MRWVQYSAQGRKANTEPKLVFSTCPNLVLLLVHHHPPGCPRWKGARSSQTPLPPLLVMHNTPHAKHVSPSYCYSLNSAPPHTCGILLGGWLLPELPLPSPSPHLLPKTQAHKVTSLMDTFGGSSEAECNGPSLHCCPW